MDFTWRSSRKDLVSHMVMVAKDFQSNFTCNHLLKQEFPTKLLSASHQPRNNQHTHPPSDVESIELNHNESLNDTERLFTINEGANDKYVLINILENWVKLIGCTYFRICLKLLK